MPIMGKNHLNDIIQVHKQQYLRSSTLLRLHTPHIWWQKGEQKKKNGKRNACTRNYAALQVFWRVSNGTKNQCTTVRSTVVHITVIVVCIQLDTCSAHAAMNLFIYLFILWTTEVIHRIHQHTPCWILTVDIHVKWYTHMWFEDAVSLW